MITTRTSSSFRSLYGQTYIFFNVPQLCLDQYSARQNPYIKMAKLFPQKRHRRTAFKSSCSTQPFLVVPGFSIPGSPTVGAFSFKARSITPSSRISSSPRSCWYRDRVAGRKAFRAQPTQVCTIVVERMKDVTEQRADEGRRREGSPARVRRTISITRRRVLHHCGLTPSMTIRAYGLSNVCQRDFHAASRTQLL